MVSWVATFVAIFAMASGVLSFPGFGLEHQEGFGLGGGLEEGFKGGLEVGLKGGFEGGLEKGLEGGLGSGLGHFGGSFGHEEVLSGGHQLGGIAGALRDHEPHQATSYQSFHLESKNPIPVISEHHSLGHFGAGSGSVGHETYTQHTSGVHGFHGF